MDGRASSTKCKSIQKGVSPEHGTERASRGVGGSQSAVQNEDQFRIFRRLSGVRPEVSVSSFLDFVSRSLKLTKCRAYNDLKYLIQKYVSWPETGDDEKS